MPRGRPPSRVESPVSPRRVGRPPKSESGVLSYGRSYYENLRIPSGVIRSNFGRRGRLFRNFGSRGIARSRSRGRRPSSSITNSCTTRSSFNKAAQDDDDHYDTCNPKDDQPSTSGMQNCPFSSAMNGFGGHYSDDGKSTGHSSPNSLLPGRYEDVNLLALIANGMNGTGDPCSVKDLVSLMNLRKLPAPRQQHLLKMLPKRDCTIGDDGLLEPTFSALKNEYLSAALLDFNERLYSGEVSPTGEIIAMPSSSPIPTDEPPSTSSFTPPTSSSSTSVQCGEEVAPSLPPLPRIRINLASKIITFIPRDGEKDSWTTSSDVLVTRRRLNSSEEGSTSADTGGTISVNGTKSRASSAGSLTEVDLTPLFVQKSVNNNNNSMVNSATMDEVAKRTRSYSSGRHNYNSHSPTYSLTTKKKKTAAK